MQNRFRRRMPRRSNRFHRQRRRFRAAANAGALAHNKAPANTDKGAERNPDQLAILNITTPPIAGRNTDFFAFFFFGFFAAFFFAHPVTLTGVD